MADCCRIATREQSTDTGSLQEPDNRQRFCDKRRHLRRHRRLHYRSGNVVVGIEYDMSWTNNSGSAFDLQPFDPNAPNTTNENCVNTLCARAGMVQDRWLSYVTASGALAGTKVSVCNTPGCASDSATRLGRTVGAGLKYALVGNWTLKAEYLFSSTTSILQSPRQKGLSWSRAT